MQPHASNRSESGFRRTVLRSVQIATLIFITSLSAAATNQELPVIRCGAPVGTTYHASRGEGERELDQLARSAGIEDAWVFLEPGSLWIDVGRDETSTSVFIDTDPLCDALSTMRWGTVTIYLYHIHPRRVLPPGRIYPADANDVYSAINLKRLLRDRYGDVLVAQVFDGYGVWHYDATEGLERSLRLPDYSGDEMRWISYSEAQPYGSPRDLMMLRYGDFLVDVIGLLEPITTDGAIPRDQRIDDYIRKARLLGILLDYRRSGSLILR